MFMLFGRFGGHGRLGMAFVLMRGLGTGRRRKESDRQRAYASEKTIFH